ncbi:alcohol dehydrogenase [Rhizoctonia solani]|nr:alcohol dehydrogenase [Rhizoctonia solani]
MATIPTVAKAWRFPPTEPSLWNGHRSLELRDVSVPKPGKGEVLVRMRAVALNARLGQYPGTFTKGPDNGGLIPTSDGAGEIVAVGEGVTRWTIGDRIHSLFSESWVTGPVRDEHWLTMIGSRTQGCLTQYRIFPADFCMPVPPHLSYDEAASITCAGITAFNALFEFGSTTPESTVLMLGSGGVSVYGAQFAKAIGARVIATTSSEEKARKYKELGVDHVINYRYTPNWADEVKNLTGGQGVDQVFEIGGQGTLMEAIKSIKPGGMVHVISVPQEGTPAASVRELAMALMMKYGKLNGVATGPKDVAERLDAFISKHNIKPVLDTKVFGWGEAIEAFDYINSGAHFGKVVIRID